MHIKGGRQPPQPGLRHRKLLKLLIAGLSAEASRASESQKVAAKSPWEEKRVTGRKVEGLTRAEGPEGVPLLWG